MEAVGVIAVVVLVVAALVGLDKNRFNEHQRRIVAYLGQKGATHIQVTRLLEGDKGTSTYEVNYTNAEGDRRQTRCKIQVGMFDNNGDIYWRDPT